MDYKCTCSDSLSQYCPPNGLPDQSIGQSSLNGSQTANMSELGQVARAATPRSSLSTIIHGCTDRGSSCPFGTTAPDSDRGGPTKFDNWRQNVRARCRRVILSKSVRMHAWADGRSDVGRSEGAMNVRIVWNFIRVYFTSCSQTTTNHISTYNVQRPMSKKTPRQLSCF